MENTTVSKLQKRASAFDECLEEMSSESQLFLTDLTKWISQNMMQKGGGTDSAKELIIQVLRYKQEEKK